MFCSKLGVSTELNVPTHPSLNRTNKTMLSRFQSGRAFVSCVLKDIYLVRNLEHLRGVRLMFEKKNSKRARVKKKERKKTSVFFCLFSPSQKKNLFHSHKTHRHQISNSSSSFVRRTRKKTHTHIYIYYYHI